MEALELMMHPWLLSFRENEELVSRILSTDDEDVILEILNSQGAPEPIANRPWDFKEALQAKRRGDWLKASMKSVETDFSFSKNTLSKRKRPVSRSDEEMVEIAGDICHAVSRGAFLAAVCEQEDMPSVVDFGKWTGTSPEIASMYSSALFSRAEISRGGGQQLAVEAASSGGKGARDLILASDKNASADEKRARDLEERSKEMSSQTSGGLVILPSMIDPDEAASVLSVASSDNMWKIKQVRKNFAAVYKRAKAEALKDRQTLPPPNDHGMVSEDGDDVFDIH